ncbi:MAG: deoxyguanosinetriphosphate triphosphohydrolase, partial [Pseudomonadota bacterium]
LERRYALFDGLNLTWETLEGLVKHNGPLVDRDGDALDGEIPKVVRDYDLRHPLDLWSWPSVEAQCAAIADDIAYDNHDLEDGLRAGLFDIEQLVDVPLTSGLLAQVRELYPGLERTRTIHEIVRRQITAMVEDVIEESTARLAQAAPRSAADVRAADYAMVAFSKAMELQEKELKAWLFANVYRSEAVRAPVRVGQQILGDLFDALHSGRASMPSSDEWRLEGLGDSDRLQRIIDYLAGMTDRYAIKLHRATFDHTPSLR